MPRATWLPDALRAEGVTVVEVDGWGTRGSTTFEPRGVVVHHDGYSSSVPTRSALALMKDGRGGHNPVPGPLCNIWLDDDNENSPVGGDPVAYVVAAGRANHAGPGSWRGLSGNTSVIGIEARHSGSKIEPWAPAVYDAYVRTVAALCRHGIPISNTCFPADTTVLCRDGLKFIQDVQPGDEVLTHLNRWRRVTRTTVKRDAATVRVRGHGHPGLRCTPDHLIRSFAEKRGRVSWNNSANNLLIGEAGWVEAADMAGRLWSTPAGFSIGDTEPPPIEVRRHETERAISPELMWVVGRWVADGCSHSNGAITVYGGPGEAAVIEERVRSAGFRCWTRPTGDNVTGTTFTSLPLHRWFAEHFGKLAHGKRIPGWLFDAQEKYRTAFLDGYLTGDGHEVVEGRWEASTVSKRLAFGIKLLGQTLGYSATVYYEDRPPTAVIRGRVVSQRPRWRIRLTSFTSHRQQFWHRDGAILSRVRSVEADEPTTVYDITVEEDHSFVADSIVVHNCGHREWAPARKIDPTFDMNQFRRDVAARIGAAPIDPGPPPPSQVTQNQLTSTMYDDQAVNLSVMLGQSYDLAGSAAAWPVLGLGSTGEWVRMLQGALRWVTGEPLVIDGQYGPITVNTVQRVQQICKIPVTGRTNQKTWDCVRFLVGVQASKR